LYANQEFITELQLFEMDDILKKGFELRKISPELINQFNNI
jgi:hypothetical protein